MTSILRTELTDRPAVHRKLHTATCMKLHCLTVHGEPSKNSESLFLDKLREQSPLIGMFKLCHTF